MYGWHYVVSPLQTPQPEIDLEGESKPFILSACRSHAWTTELWDLGDLWGLPPLPVQAATEAESEKGWL